MKKTILQSLFLLALALCVSAASYAQDVASAKAVTNTVKDSTPATAITAATSPIDLARIALAAHGGEKYKSLKSMELRGSVDLYPPNSIQAIPGKFLWVVAGDKLRLEIDARPAATFKQLYDGQRSYSSLEGVDLPPASKFGLPLLARFDQPGYTVTPVPDKKKLRGFRISDAEGNVTDFYLDSTTGRVISFSIPYAGHTFATENKKFKDVDGVLVPVSFTQRLVMPLGLFFADYSVKDVKLNNPIEDNLFAIPK
jgi:hypothetical protein